MRVLDDADWDTLADLRTLLAPIAAVQKLMQGEKFITLSEVPFHAFTLRKHLTAMAADPSSRIRDTAQLMLEDFDARWPQKWPRAVMMAVALDPRTKLMKCFNSEQKVCSLSCDAGHQQSNVPLSLRTTPVLSVAGRGMDPRSQRDASCP